ncbi:phage tail fiber protein [Providencia sp. PROV146]
MILLENNEEREDYDYCDIPNGHWIDVRVNMPSNMHKQSIIT